MRLKTDLLLRNATVLPMTGEAPLPGRDVLIRDGRIASLAPTGGSYPDAEERDCTGLFVMPALWDMHVHLFNDEFLDYLLSWGVTGVLNMWGFEKHLKWRDKIKAGRRLGPDIYTTGPIIDSLPTYPLICLATTPQQARQAVLDTKALGYDYVKIYNNLTPEVYEAVADTAAEVGLEVLGHLPNCANADYTGEERDYAIRQKTIEHALFLNEGNTEKAAKQGVWLNPTFLVEEAYRTGLDEGAKQAVEELRPGIVNLYWKTLSGQHKKPRKGAQKTVRKELAYYDARFRAFCAAGGRVLLGTDCGFPNVVPGYSMHQELALAVTHGMSEQEALETATRVAAEFLGQGAASGTVQEGKNAELLVLGANPLEDIKATLDIRLLVKRTDAWDKEGLAAIRRRARRRPELAVDTVFRRYMVTMAGQIIKGLFVKKKAED